VPRSFTQFKQVLIQNNLMKISLECVDLMKETFQLLQTVASGKRRET
jgi:hypothetical protein